MYLTTLEKVSAIEGSERVELAFDGCHKVYLVEDKEEAHEAVEMGYSLYEANQIRKLLNESCGLVFVYAWSMNSNHPWGIEQGELYEAGFYGPVDDEEAEA